MRRYKKGRYLFLVVIFMNFSFKTPNIAIENLYFWQKWRFEISIFDIFIDEASPSAARKTV
jgi:hypothetical protein